MKLINNLVSYLIYEREWYWLDLLLSNSCELEVQLKGVFDKDFKDMLDVCTITSSKDEQCQAHKMIPKDTFYCYEGTSECPFHTISILASILYGTQRCGYCYYLGKGDFSFIRPTELLWDDVKACCLFEFEDDED